MAYDYFELKLLKKQLMQEEHSFLSLKTGNKSPVKVHSLHLEVEGKDRHPYLQKQGIQANTSV